MTDKHAKAFQGHLEPGKAPALMLVDMVQAYLEPSSPVYCPTGAAAAERAAELLAVARAAARPVIFTSVKYEVGGADGGLFFKKLPALWVFEEGCPLRAFPALLRPAPTELIVTKQYPSAFFATKLHETLSNLGADTVIIAGFSTSGCVRATALDALQYGFAPFVVRDACADRRAEAHDANLFDLQAKYAEVCDAQTAINILRRDPTAPFQHKQVGL